MVGNWPNIENVSLLGMVLAIRCDRVSMCHR